MYKRIRDLREDHDLTQKQIAKILNCSQQVYSNYELGQRDIPTDVLIALSKYYKVSTDYILGLSDNHKK
ncbi:MAG: helix-turn-helix transcriptional regulator [Clostridia bacterium]|nr:helix-turn-helix transcriptional regulator [Clostridia bacterium]